MELKQHLSLTLFVVGGFVMIAGALITYSSLKQLGYENAEGSVIDSGVRMGTGDISGSSTRTYSWEFWANYNYRVDGKLYHSNTVASQPPSSSAWNGRVPSEELERLKSVYAPGETVTVFVSPDKPQNSVLIRSDTVRLWLLLSGVLIAALGGFIRFRR